MARVLILGASGMLGHKVCRYLRGHHVTGLLRRDVRKYEECTEVFEGISLRGGVDVLNGNELEASIQALSPEVVVNCVGLVKQLEEAEDPYLAVAVNALLPHRLARLCASIGARLIHISTDCVFDGRRGRYQESDLVDATDLYGRSKALGETTPAETAAVSLRTSFIGHELMAPKHGLVEWFLAQNGGSVRGFDRVIYSGLTSNELARVIRRVIEQSPDLSGLYHLASEPISKYDLLKLIRQTYALDIEIERVEEPVCDRSLVMGAFPKATGYVVPSWPDMVRRMHQDEIKWRG